MTLQKKIQVAFGATSLVQPLTGIGQYTYHLSQSLCKNPALDIHFFTGLSWTNKAEPVSIPNIGIAKKIIKRFLPNAYEVRRNFQQLSFNNEVSKKQYDLYHESAFIPLHFDGPTVITVHDLSFIRHPETHPRDRIRVLEKYLPVALKKASSIIADSNFTKSEIMDVFGISSDKIKVTHLGKSENFFPRDMQTNDVLKNYGLMHQQYFIAVGTLEPRKNLNQIIEAYRKLPFEYATKFPLVVVGMRGWKDSNILKNFGDLLSTNRAKLAGYVPDEHLPFLYSGARALIFPSIYEGFGLPVLEAMACGTPIIASNASSIPEVLGNAGLKFEVGDVDATFEYIKLLCEDSVECARQSQLGLEQAKLFTWEKCASETYGAYLTALR